MARLCRRSLILGCLSILTVGLSARAGNPTCNDWWVSVEQVLSHNLSEAEAYLAAHEDTSQFLINNLKTHGPVLTDHHNSGNFKLIRRGLKVEGVFYLSRRGTLIIQSDQDVSDLVLQACETEARPIKGFIGEWDSVAPVYAKFQERHPEFQPSYESKEILYTYKLHAGDSKPRHDARVRRLELRDFPQWLEHTTAYMAELKLPDELDLNQKHTDFAQQIRDHIWWGLFEGQRLVSRVGLNSKGDQVGQVGGVFTPLKHRQKGFARATMLHMLKDCRDLHGHTKSILFTGEGDRPAQKLYRSLGYRQVAVFALIL